MTSLIWFCLGHSHVLKQIFHLTPDSFQRELGIHCYCVQLAVGDGEDVYLGPETGNVYRYGPQETLVFTGSAGEAAVS